MELDGMKLVLAAISALDGRQWDEAGFEATAAAWHSCVGEDMRYQDAEQAVRDYYRTERRRMMPADLLEYVGYIRTARLALAREPDPPEELAGAPMAAMAAITAAREAIMDGQDPHEAMTRVVSRWRSRQLNGQAS